MYSIYLYQKCASVVQNPVCLMDGKRTMVVLEMLLFWYNTSTRNFQYYFYSSVFFEGDALLEVFILF